MKFAPKGVDFLYLSAYIGSPENPQLKVMQKVSRFFHLPVGQGPKPNNRQDKWKE